jgi:hypothetical protein
MSVGSKKEADNHRLLKAFTNQESRRGSFQPPPHTHAVKRFRVSIHIKIIIIRISKYARTLYVIV